jgi:sortase A
MIRAGIVVLLFVAYQLWGTGLSTARAQDRLDSSFADRLATVTPSIPPGAPPDAPSDAPPDATPDAVATELPVPELGDPVGRLRLPTIDSDHIVVQGVDLSLLRDGPGHFPQTVMPGQPGNAAIAGHRTTYGAPFNRLNELQPGDPITVTTLQGTFDYVVDAQPDPSGKSRGYFVVGPDDVGILDPVNGSRLTLMACHPKFSAAQRIVVTATLRSPPAPPTPVPHYAEAVTNDASIDPLAGGDPDAWFPALLWSVPTILVWFGVWFAARRWDRLPAWGAYALGTPVVLLLLFVTFTKVARLLPASY